MKKLLLVLIMSVTGNALVACTSTEAITDEKREVASDPQVSEQAKAHQKYLEKIDKIR